ncbi:MAG: Gfo/Idh/MocA family oxidoreductase [Acidimicrobiales bacterium]
MTPVTGPIRWGIAGTGGIAASFVSDFARLDTGNSEIGAVGSRSRASADAFAATHGIPRAHGTYEELAADPEIDIVYVAGIHPVHAEQAVMFLDAGKHVLVEKPLALDAGEVDTMIAAAERNDRFLMEAMWMRFNPAHVEMVRRIEAGAIGEVRRVIADFSFALPFDADHRLWDRRKGGGALLDLGIYPLTLAWWLLGPPTSVDATGHVADTGVDDEVAMLCGWEGGATALLTAGLRLDGTLAARIEGTKGTIELPLPAHCTDRMTLRYAGESEEITAEPAGLHHQVVEVHRCLRAGERESPRMPWATSRAVIERFDAIRATLGVRYGAD